MGGDPCRKDEQRQRAIKPDFGGAWAGLQGIAGVWRSGRRPFALDLRQAVDERQDFAGAGGPAFRLPATVLIDDGAVVLGCFFKRSRSATRFLNDSNVRHRALQLAKDVAGKIDVARVFGCKANDDGQALLEP